ncbi:MAG TPA: transcription antitermination factor NusB [Candidatus Eisenbacteria bacterium]|nr:transcription antitermination factor NusB [Candidatus Eisenbacteria bacterium]
MNPRSQGRELAFRAVYQADVTGEEAARCLEEIVDEAGSADARADAEEARAEGEEGRGTPPVAEAARTFAATLVSELQTHREAVDALVTRTAVNWPLRRMAATDRSVLRLAVVELLHHAETPTRVALDEAIELAKKYGSETSGSFVNGVLDRIAHEARPSPE